MAEQETCPVCKHIYGTGDTPGRPCLTCQRTGRHPGLAKRPLEKATDLRRQLAQAEKEMRISQSVALVTTKRLRKELAQANERAEKLQAAGDLAVWLLETVELREIMEGVWGDPLEVHDRLVEAGCMDHNQRAEAAARKAKESTDG